MKRLAFGLMVAASVQSATPASQQPQFRTSVDVVELNIAVTDGKKVVTDLTAADFEVFDNGVKQSILTVSREKLPIDVTLVIDTNGNTSGRVREAVTNAARRIRDSLNAADRLALVTFGERVQEREPLQPARSVREFTFSQPSTVVSLNDALAVVLTSKPVDDRRQMAIVFTDSVDGSSFLTENDVRSLAARSHTSMFFVTRQWQAGSWGNAGPPIGISLAPARQPVTFFHQIATVTGGIAQIVPALSYTTGGSWIKIGPNTNLLDGPFLNALNDFRSSYFLRYSLEGVTRRGWHEVTVKVTRPGNQFLVRTRNGYEF